MADDQPAADAAAPKTEMQWGVEVPIEDKPESSAPKPPAPEPPAPAQAAEPPEKVVEVVVPETPVPEPVAAPLPPALEPEPEPELPAKEGPPVPASEPEPELPAKEEEQQEKPPQAPTPTPVIEPEEEKGPEPEPEVAVASEAAPVATEPEPPAEDPAATASALDEPPPVPTPEPVPAPAPAPEVPAGDAEEKPQTSPPAEDAPKSEQVLVERGGKFVMVEASELEMDLSLAMPGDDAAATTAAAAEASASPAREKKPRAKSARAKPTAPTPPQKPRPASAAPARKRFPHTPGFKGPPGMPKFFNSEEARDAYEGWYIVKQRKLAAERKRKKELEEQEKAQEEHAKRETLDSSAAAFGAWKAQKARDDREKEKAKKADPAPKFSKEEHAENAQQNQSMFDGWIKAKEQKKREVRKRETMLEEHLTAGQMTMDQLQQLNEQAVKEWKRQKALQRKMDQAKTRKLVQRHTREARRIAESLRRVTSPHRPPRGALRQSSPYATTFGGTSSRGSSRPNSRPTSARSLTRGQSQPNRLGLGGGTGGGAAAAAVQGSPLQAGTGSAGAGATRRSVFHLEDDGNVDTSKPAWNMVPFRSQTSKEAFDDWAMQKDRDARARREEEKEELKGTITKKEVGINMSGEVILGALSNIVGYTGEQPFTTVIEVARKIFQAKMKTDKDSGRALLDLSATISRRKFFLGMRKVAEGMDATQQGDIFNSLADAKDVVHYADFEFFLVGVRSRQLMETMSAEIEGDGDEQRKARHSNAAITFLATTLLRRMGVGRRSFGDVMLRSKRAFFDKYDVDKDGHVDLQEWKDGLSRAFDSPVILDAAEALFHAIDSDESGSLDYIEFESLLIKCCHGTGNHTNVLDKHDLAIGDVAYVPKSLATTITVSSTWPESSHRVDLCLAMFAKDHSLLGTCYIDETKPASLNKAVELINPGTTESGETVAAIKIRLCQLPAAVDHAALYVVSQAVEPAVELSAFESFHIKVTGPKGEPVGGFVADTSLAAIGSERSSVLATISRTREWAFSYWPDSSEGLPGVPANPAKPERVPSR